MKAALIAPNNLKYWELKGDMLFIIADPEMSKELKKFYRKSKMYKMLDNGAYETGAVAREQLLQLAAELRVQEIVIPDKIGDPDFTRWEAYKWFSPLPRKYKYAYVPQGKDPLQWLTEYRIARMFDWIDTICLPVWLDKVFHCRSHLVNYLVKCGQWSRRHQHHLIGLDSLFDLYSLPHNKIRSVDTSLPFSATFHKLSTMHYTISHDRVNLKNAEMDEKLLSENVEAYLTAVHWVG